MIKLSNTLSKITKFIFYALMLYFIYIVAGIQSGSYQFADYEKALYFMTFTASMAAVSLLLADLPAFLKKIGR